MDAITRTVQGRGKSMTNLTRYAYEHGFADGVKEGKRLGVIEALKPYDAESVEDLIQNVRNKAIEEFLETLNATQKPKVERR